MKKGRRKKQKTKVAKRKSLTAAEKQSVRALADKLGRLIPLAGYRSSFSLTNIAKDNDLAKYLPRRSANKKEAFAAFLESLVCHKPRTLKNIIRDMLPKAIEKRHREGNPVLEEEAMEFAEQLHSLGIDLRKEIADLKLPKERPRIVPPPIEIQKILEAFILHPKMMPDSKDMFIQGHLNEAVRKSLERFEKTVQELSTLNDKQGPDLMATAFSETDPKISLNALSNTQERNEQVGFKFLTMGLMHWWRNNLSHGDEAQMPHHEALGRLILISNLFHKLDGRVE
jgi:uncharacterized protein (TIGR02391 family)